MKKLPSPVVTPPPKSPTQDTNITNPSSNNNSPSSQSRKIPKVISSPKRSSDSGSVSGSITKENTTK
jgi:hypothetical protein